MHIGEILGWKFGHAEGICTCDGEITEWPESLGPRPTTDQIATWTVEYEAAIPDIEADNGVAEAYEGSTARRLLFEVNFDQENRLRALEGKPAVTEAQYRAALKGALKALPR